VTHLAVRILAVVAADPSITTNGVCRKLKARKTDVIDELERMRRGRLLQFEHGKRGAKHWYPVAEPGNQFPQAARGTAANSRDISTETAS